jgi:hypothetical protein
LASAANTNGNLEQGTNAENLFPLDTPEFAVRFRSGPKIFRHVFRRITAADWEAYDHVIEEAADEGGGKAGSIYQDTASLVLFARAIVQVTGYRTRDGRAPEKLPNWPECIPQHHRLFAIDILLEKLGAIAKGTFQIGADRKSVSFVVERGDESESSTSIQSFGVTHHFRMPTADHRRRFLHAMSKLPSARKMLVSLYDELAERAEGYSFRGEPIAPGQLQSEMCYGQKAYAVCALLLSPDDCDLDPCRKRTITLPLDFLGMIKAAPATIAGAAAGRRS